MNLNCLFLLLFIYLVKLYLHDGCHLVDHVYMYGGSDEPINIHIKLIAQTNCSTKHISNRYGDAMRLENTKDVYKKCVD
jgi:hypothetical protein